MNWNNCFTEMVWQYSDESVKFSISLEFDIVGEIEISCGNETATKVYTLIF